jgi:hypothetical protein
MIDDVLRKIARQLMALNEDSLKPLLPKYKERMLKFTPTGEWEESVLIYFMINGLRIKNSQFEEKVREYILNASESEKAALLSRPKLRLVKHKENGEDEERPGS